MSEIVDNVVQWQAVGSTLAEPTAVPPFRRVLMVAPDFFRVEYAINPYMKDATGQLKTVDPARARRQWDELRLAYQRIGFAVEVLPGQPELPDMVFAANQSFPFWDPWSNGPAVLLSQMASPFRRPEVPFFREWYKARGIPVHELTNPDFRFEGNGDALSHPNRSWIWGGCGPRTEPAVYDEIAGRFGIPVLRLELRNPDYYHLDTCFSILDERTVAMQPEAFTEEGVALIRTVFERVVVLDAEENLRAFAGNCHSPDGKHVLLHPGSPKLCAELGRLGFTPIEIDTSEFLKSGGSVFCMKMMLF